MNIFQPYLSLLTSLLIALLGFYVYLRNRGSAVNRQFFFFTLAVFVWLSFYSVAYFLNEPRSIYWFRIGYVGILFIPTTWLNFVVLLLNRWKAWVALRICYFLSFLFLMLNFVGNVFIADLYVYKWGFYPKVNLFLHLSFLIFFISVFSVSITFLLLEILFKAKDRSALQAARVRYVFFATIIGTFAGVDFLPNYGIDVFPFGFIFMLLFIFITALSIIRYRFLDISIAFTRTGVFIFVYSFVLGIPFTLAFGFKDYLFIVLGQNWWMVPLVTSTLLGAAGPFIYLYVQRKTEERLLADQKRYQSTLKQASAGMTRIKDLKKLLNLIVYILSRTVNLTHAFLYLYNPKSRDYTLEAARGEKLSEKNYYVSRRSALIDYLEKAKLPIVAEEVKQQSQDYNNESLREVYAQLREIGAEVAVPILTEKRLLAIGVLGKKKTGAMYTPDDLTVFSILASQVALAIENAQFYEESKQTQQQLFQAEKMATIGTMADGLSHQINNRLHTLGFIAGDALDTIKLSKDVQDPVKFQAVLAEISKALAKIQDNVRQGGEIVQGLLRYTRKGQEGFREVVFDKLVDEVVEMAQFKIKKEYVAIIKDYPQDLPPIQGNFTQLQEVFFNIIDNAYDAIMQKKSEVPDENFMGKIKISTRQTEKFLEINVLDNGMGVKEDDQTKLFTPFFTTKVSSRKGTGLGLYVIKKIIEDNHQGEVFISSENKIGTLFVVRLPIGKKG